MTPIQQLQVLHFHLTSASNVSAHSVIAFGLCQLELSDSVSTAYFHVVLILPGCVTFVSGSASFAALEC